MHTPDHAFGRLQQTLSRDGLRGPFALALLGAALTAATVGWAVFARVPTSAMSVRLRTEVTPAPYPVVAATQGTLLRRLVNRDDLVTRGQLLFELDSSAPAIEREGVVNRLAAVHRQTEALETYINALRDVADGTAGLARVSSRQAALRLRDLQTQESFLLESSHSAGALREKGIVATLEAQRAASALASAKADRAIGAIELRRKSLALSLSRKSNEAQIAELQKEAVEAKGTEAVLEVYLEQLDEELLRRQIRSPADGRIGDISDVQPKQTIAAAERLAWVVPQGQYHAVAQFEPRVASGRVLAGQRATIMLDAFPWTEFGRLQAQVTNVATEARDGLIRVDLEIIDWGTVTPQHGLPGRAEITLRDDSPLQLVLKTFGR